MRTSLYFLILIIFYIPAEASNKCDEQGKDGVKLILTNEQYKTKKDINAKSVKDYFGTKSTLLYCSNHEPCLNNSEWFTYNEFINYTAGDKKVICAYRQYKVINGDVQKSIVIYTAK